MVIEISCDEFEIFVWHDFLDVDLGEEAFGFFHFFEVFQCCSRNNIFVEDTRSATRIEICIMPMLTQCQILEFLGKM